ncbi:hypothetical protein OEZ85_005715 [Tetradesmus obliquus]|uniref:VAN3-binding protein-like auxin canalisation domain-containing protein n=1 Tax=Tetradesmus obliquus TaxID=3088 RepID=A0ABY8UFH6_TETOB|nr:hypothetical protein OEZ85_005715 [Tetradesmus obliquus]
MSLLGLSASAVAGARAGNKRSADAAADEHQAAHASAVKLNLQQLAASVAACKATADQTSKEQHITDAVAAVQVGCTRGCVPPRSSSPVCYSSSSSSSRRQQMQKYQGCSRDRTAPYLF